MTEIFSNAWRARRDRGNAGPSSFVCSAARTQAAAGGSEGLRKIWILLKSTVLSFIEDDALSKGAAIAFYTVTSIAPILLIVVAIAGLAFGREAAQNGIVAQLTGLMGKESAQLLQTAIAGAQNKSSGTLAPLIGVATIIVTASGVFGEMQSALNTIWK